MQQRIIIYYIRGIKGRELEPEEREGRQEEEDEEGGWVGGLGFNQLICHAKQAGRQAGRYPRRLLAWHVGPAAEQGGRAGRNERDVRQRIRFRAGHRRTAAGPGAPCAGVHG